MPNQPSQDRVDFVEQSVIQQYVGTVEPGGEVPMSTILGSVVISLVVVLGTTAWWMWR
jgi:hypothetical protein